MSISEVAVFHMPEGQKQKVGRLAIKGRTLYCAEDIIDEIREAASRWKMFAEDAAVSSKSSAMVYAALVRVHSGL